MRIWLDVWLFRQQIPLNAGERVLTKFHFEFSHVVETKAHSEVGISL